MARKNQPHGRRYSRSRHKESAQALIEEDYYDDYFDPAIPAEEVGGGDPGLTSLLAAEIPATAEAPPPPALAMLATQQRSEGSPKRVFGGLWSRIRSLFVAAS